MARPLRIEYSGACYHIINRGLERRDIFRHPKDYEYFLGLLNHIYEKYGVVLYAYCLMPNHYHLFLKTPQGNLKSAMRQLDGNYTQKFNRRYSRVGPLFQGRYKAVLADADSYSLQLAKYIHLNPVKAKLVQKPEDYPYSSYSAYIGKTKAPEFLNTNWLLSQYHKSNHKAVRELKKHTQEAEQEPWTPEQDTFKGLILGSGGFVEEIQGSYLAKKSDPELSGLEITKKQVSTEQIEAIVEKFDLNRKLSNKLMMYALQKYTHLSLKIIGQRTDRLHYSTVSHKIGRLLKESEKDKALQKLLQKIDTAVQCLKK